MIIVEIIGGLGNQLFEYAYARNLAEKFNLPLKLDLSFFKTYERPDVYRLDRYNIDQVFATDAEIKKIKRIQIKNFSTKVLSKIIGIGFYRNNKYHIDEDSFQYDKRKLLEPKSLYLSGYWQSEKYFIENAKIIREEFVLKEILNKKNQAFLEKINACNSVAVHIRRGDYVNNSFFVNLSLDYYKKAMEIIKLDVDNPEFFFFSDDLNWVEDNLQIDSNYHFVDINESKTDYFDLKLMSSCKHNIIANSSFSWWGGWLNSNSHKLIVAPKIWFNDKKKQSYCEKNYLPKAWMKI